MLLFTLWLLVPLVFAAGWLWLTRGKPLRHVGTLHFLIYFLSIYAASWEIYAANEHRNDAFIFSVIAYPTLALLGSWLVCLLTGIGVVKGRIPFRPPSARERRVVRWMGLLLFTALGLYLIILGRRIPILTLIASGREAGQAARSLATKGYGDAIGTIGPLVWGGRLLIDYFGLFLLIYEYGRARVAKRGYRRLLVLAVVLVVLTIAFNETYPVAKLLTYFALFVTLGINRPTVTPRFLAWTAILLVILLPVVGVVHDVATSGPGSLGELGPNPIGTLYYEGWVQLVDRGMRGQITGLYYVYEIIPRRYDFFWGRTYTNPHRLLPYDQVVLPHIVYDWHLVSPPGVRGSDPSIFFGEVYANFGHLSSWFVMFGIGAVMQLATMAFRRVIARRGSPYYVALFYMTMVYLGDLAVGSPTLWFDERLWLIGILFFLPRIGWSTPDVARGRVACDA